MESAVVLNEGRRRDALLKLAEFLGVSVWTVRAWAGGSRAMPQHYRVTVEQTLRNRKLESAVAEIKALLTGLEEQHG